ncbi:MAG TPA: alpha/beta fold hydrolase [Burkholderiaceae bacterium]|jgi:pimeloyl-ACP methyl ester carboxylesterase/DNA-binding CsgD family transcriptional regulator|nr:alpha/beta fold hydrolase [Burkholderiaceae bacterium]
MSPNQQIRFCRSRDGTRIAYATFGSGPPVVRACHVGTHLELEWHSPVWKPLLLALGRSRQLVRYDPRGCGLSDRDVQDHSLERQIEDLDAVIAACGVPRTAVAGVTGGGAVAVAYSAQYPERVNRLLLLGSFVRGRIARSTTPAQAEECETLLRLIEIGWDRGDPAFRQLYSSQFFPDGTADEFASFNELLRQSAPAANAARFLRTMHAVDLTEFAPRVVCPTLVLHSRNDSRVPFDEGRALAAMIPNARFVPLESRNHLLLEREPAWARLTSEIDGFLSAPDDRHAAVAERWFAELTRRERQVLVLVAEGLDNATIGERLEISSKTVRNNVSVILSKLGVRTRSQAIVRAHQAGIGLHGPL